MVGSIRPVSDLLPNLDALLQQLNDDTAARRDACELARAVQTAGTLDEVDEQLNVVVTRWREQ
ncbi:hypothetical protein GCM10011594_31870 [Nakamurella endophytica]|uniref:Uncharacterized protein n=1 Tax=Nakamurella endophytica TaxID=1748367 RepID=A0A917T441_9ACTN|nr:hypothetical protein GCM10011594_31870 [Nakamurella endophytica]